MAVLLLLSTGLCCQVPERFEDPKEKERKAPEERSAEDLVEGEKKKAGSGEERIWDRLVWGGGASLQFGQFTLIYVSPSVGYRFNDNLIAGGGYIYQYIRVNEIYNYQSRSFQQVDDVSDRMHGPKAFVNYLMFENFYAGTQLEVLNHDFRYFDNQFNQRVENRWTPVLFLEAGFTSEIGRKGYAVAGLRYNILHDVTSPYFSPLFPVVAFYF